MGGSLGDATRLESVARAPYWIAPEGIYFLFAFLIFFFLLFEKTLFDFLFGSWTLLISMQL